MRLLKGLMGLASMVCGNLMAPTKTTIQLCTRRYYKQRQLLLLVCATNCSLQKMICKNKKNEKVKMTL